MIPTEEQLREMERRWKLAAPHAQFAQSGLAYNGELLREAEREFFNAIPILIAALREARSGHDLAITNLANALCPNGPLDSAKAEFDFGADGACQIIERIQQERDLARKALRELVDAAAGSNLLSGFKDWSRFVNAVTQARAVIGEREGSRG